MCVSVCVNVCVNVCVCVCVCMCVHMLPNIDSAAGSGRFIIQFEAMRAVHNIYTHRHGKSRFFPNL